MKCKDCIYYIENPNFDLYDNSKGSYASCKAERDDKFESEFTAVYQETWGYEVDCSDYKAKVRYRKKPVIIEAEVYREGMEDGFDSLGYAITNGLKSQDYINPVRFGGVPYIITLEGKHYINKGDYIITGVKGERYPCKPDIFEMTYEKVD